MIRDNSVIIIADEKSFGLLWNSYFAVQSKLMAHCLSRWANLNTPFFVWTNLRPHAERRAEFPADLAELEWIVKRIESSVFFRRGIWSNCLALDSPADKMVRSIHRGLPIYLPPDAYYARQERLRTSGE